MHLGLNHTTAALSLREKLAFSLERPREVRAFRARLKRAKAVLFTTCNRVPRPGCVEPE